MMKQVSPIFFLSFFFSATSAESLLKDMNCSSLTGTRCLNHMRSYMRDQLLLSEEYNALSLPVERPYWDSNPRPEEDTDYSAVSIRLSVTFNDLTTVDMVTGSVVVQAYIDMHWTDTFATWDPEWTDGFESLNIDSSLLWMPDVILYNAVGSYEDMMGAPAIFLYSNGTVWWSGKGMLVFSCTFDTTDFPFDEQKCVADFASWIYTTYQLNITDVTYAQSDHFDNLAWEVKRIEAKRVQVVQWEIYDFAFASYTLTIERYATHYLQTAIIPSIVVTYTTLLALWIPTVQSRLGLSITGLLTIIAIQWSISSELPVSENTTWIARFSNGCISFIAMVIAECYFAGYMLSKKPNTHVPQWVIAMIRISLLNRHSKPQSREDDENGANGSQIQLTKGTPHASEDTHLRSDGEATQAMDISWGRGARALDRLSRVLLPLLYSLFLVVFFAPHSAS